MTRASYVACFKIYCNLTEGDKNEYCLKIGAEYALPCCTVFAVSLMGIRVLEPDDCSDLRGS